MGWQATGWAFKSPIENSGCKFVLVALAERAGNEDDDCRTWHCRPSIPTIAKYTAQGYRTIQRHLDWLDARGFLTRERRVQSKGKLGSFKFALNPQGVPDGQWPKKTDDHASNGQTEPVIGTGHMDVMIRAPDPFDQWWAVYPRKMAKVAARKAWTKVPAALAKSELTLADLMDRTRAFADHVVDKDQEHIAHPATWLNGERWNDELPDRSQTDGKPRTTDRGAAQHDARIANMLAGAEQALGRHRRWRL